MLKIYIIKYKLLFKI